MISIGWFPAASLLGIALFSATTAAHGGTTPVEVQIQGKGTSRWVEATPEAQGSPVQLLPVANGAASIVLPGLAPGAAILCAGGDEGATACQRVVLDAESQSVAVPGPVPGVRLTGRILNGKTPLAGASLGIIPDQLHLRRFFSLPLERQGEKLIRTVSSDPEGRFVIPLLAPGTYRLNVHSPGGRIDLGEPFTVPPPEKLRTKEKVPAGPPLLDLGDVVLEDGVRVEVSVVDTAGQPVAKAGVGAGQMRPDRESSVFEAHTDANGLAVLTRIDPALPLSVTCAAPGFVRLEQSFDAVPGLVQCVLTRLSRIEGRLVDAGGEPLLDATVALSPEGRTKKPLLGGEFSFAGLSPGRYVLTATAPGMQAVRRPVEVGPEETKRETLRMAPAEPIEGEVLDSLTKKPVAAAAVRVVEPPGLSGAETDEEGRFTLEAGSEGPLSLEVEATGYPVTPVEVSPEQQGADEPVRIDLSPGGRIAVEVWDEETDLPCAGCTVLLQQGTRMHSLTTAADGSARSDLLPVGRYSVTAERVRSLGSVVTVRGGEERREAVVAPHQTVTVRLGEPLQKIQVAFSPPPPGGWNLLVETGDRVHFVERSADGTFLVRKLRETEATLFLIPPSPSGARIRQAVLPAELSGPVLTLSLADGEVHGTVFRGEEAAPGEPLLLVSAEDGALVAKTGTDEQGAFSIPFVPPGVYHLVAGRQPVKTVSVGHGPASLGTVVLPGQQDRREPGG